MRAERWRRIEEAYFAALERPESERAAFIVNAAGGDVELQKSIEALLRPGEGPTAGLLDSFVCDSLPEAKAMEPEGGRLESGTMVGTYRIESPIGEGGMGVVYRAIDTKLNRPIAIKFLSSRLADTGGRRRFQREAQTASSLNHPHIVMVHDAGDFDGRQYLVTEFVDGGTLHDWRREHPPDWRSVVELMAGVADALATAHASGILHRDIKPGNILMTKSGYAKLADFGLAKLVEPDLGVGHRPTTMTGLGVLVGTIGYMSPEQAACQPLDGRSDIFSFGIVLYELLTGHHPFAGANGIETLHNVMHAELPPMSAGVPIPVQQAVSKALAKNPGERWQSMRELVTELRGLVRPGDTAGIARLDTTTPARRSRLVWGAGVPVLVTAAAFAFWANTSHRGTNSVAVLPFVNASGNADMEYLSDGITESLINDLSQIPGLQIMSRNSAFRYKGREGEAQKAGQELNVQAVLTGRVVQRGDDLSISAELIDTRTSLHLWGAQYNRKLRDILAVQDEISREITDRLKLNLSTGKKTPKRYTDSTEAYQLYLQGRFYWNKKTPAGFNKGIEFFQEAIDRDPNYAPAYAALATIYYNQANYNFALIPASEAWPKAEAAAEKALRIDDSLAAAHAAEALVAYQWEWNWPKADKEFRRAIELDPSSSSTYEPTPASTYHWYSHYLMSTGKVRDSFTTGRKALALDAGDLAISSHQGWYYLWTREFGKGIEPLEKTAEMDPGFVVTQWYLGLLFEQEKTFDKAIAQFESCVRITNGRPSMRALLGHAYAVAGQEDKARAILAQLKELSNQTYVPPYPVAVIYAGLGDRDQSVAWLEKAYDQHDSWMPYLGVDPRLDGLRSDPRFQNLITRMRLPRQVSSLH